MASEIRVNSINNRSGLGTITVADTGIVVSGLITATTFSGNITGVAATFTGNVSIAGTLTYEDVTNIDSVGLITARSGVVLTGGNVTLGTGVTASGSTSNTFTLSTNGSERLRITSAGLVGIGTSSPSSLLHLSVATAASDGTKGVRITNPAGTAAMFECGSSNDSYVGTTSGSDFSIRTNNTSRIYVTNGGNVGIGTMSPTSAQLYVNSSEIYGVRINHATLPLQSFLVNGTQAFSIGANSGGGGSFYYGTGNLTAATIDSSGRLLVGTSSARTNLEGGSFSALAQIETAVGSASNGLSIINNTSTGFSSRLRLGMSGGNSVGSNAIVGSSGAVVGRISFEGADGTNMVPLAAIDGVTDGTVGANDMPGRLVFSTTADGASSPTERMRIDNTGGILFGRTVLGNIGDSLGIAFGGGGAGYGYFERSGGPSIYVRRATSTGNAVEFFQGTDTYVGSISVTASATAYNTSSDYRLKENVKLVTDGINRLQQLKPSRFNFIADPDTVVDGFIAHEVQAVVPEAITGEKDAVDEDGNPVYQGIDQSKLVPLLTAALQEAVAKIESLEARLTAAGI